MAVIKNWTTYKIIKGWTEVTGASIFEDYPLLLFLKSLNDVNGDLKVYNSDKSKECHNFNTGDTIVLKLSLYDIGGTQSFNNVSKTLRWVKPDGSVVEQSITSNSDVSLTVNEAGLHTFSVESYSTFINVKRDTGWQSVTYLSGYANYSTSNTLRYRVIDNMVQITGYWTTNSSRSASSDDVQFASIPSEYAPPNPVRSRSQGSGMNTYLFTVGTTGKLNWSRYGTTSSINLPSGFWGVVNGTYFID